MNSNYLFGFGLGCLGWTILFELSALSVNNSAYGIACVVLTAIVCWGLLKFRFPLAITIPIVLTIVLALFEGVFLSAVFY